MTRVLAIMGSGETAPTMVTPHQQLVRRLRTKRAVLLETPYGFQENADDISAKARGYFATSVGLDVGVAGLRSRDDEAAVADRGLAALTGATWVFAGPGSPSYALAQWVNTPVATALVDRVRTGDSGVTIFSSAAACTLGSAALPVYEVYKVGMPAVWLDGLDLMGAVGLPDVAVVPHFDNTEGGNHDTRFCYMGERRLAQLEAQRPVGILGVDEHTALVLDLEAGSAEVVGRGGVTARWQGRSHPVPRTVGLDDLAALLRGAAGPGHAAAAPAAAPAGSGAGRTPAEPAAGSLPSLRTDITTAEQAFAAAADARDATGMAEAICGLDRAIVGWAADTLQSDDLDAAHATLRALVLRLADSAAAGLSDPVSQLSPVIDPLLGLRAQLRQDRQFAVADEVRDAILAAGVVIKDGPEGTSWELAPAS